MICQLSHLRYVHDKLEWSVQYNSMFSPRKNLMYRALLNIILSLNDTKPLPTQMVFVLSFAHSGKYSKIWTKLLRGVCVHSVKISCLYLLGDKYGDKAY